MSELTYKKIIDVETVEALNDAATVFINDGGAMKQVGADKFGAVKTVNGIAPDENGDIAVKIPEPVQPDWNQNDPEAPDYVKNRTHWTETKREIVVEETTITGANGQFTVINALKTDGKYIVNYNGTEYECMPKTDPSGDLALGNLSIAKSTLENTGEPFLLTGMSSAGAITYALFADGTGTHVFAAFEVIETVHTIDPKYLPAGGSGGGVAIHILTIRNENGESKYSSNMTYDELRQKLLEATPLVGFIQSWSIDQSPGLDSYYINARGCIEELNYGMSTAEGANICISDYEYGDYYDIKPDGTIEYGQHD